MRGANLAGHAFAIAEAAHAGQVDKGGRIYILHPQRVGDQFSGEEARAVGYLHDAIEDTPLTIHLLAAALHCHEPALVGRIVVAVTALTRRLHEPNEDYWARVKSNPLARRVKLADIQDNLDSERMAKLDEATRERLWAKYRRALEVLS